MFFVQIRIGKNEKPFNILKLRTMEDRSGSKRDSIRVTRLGRALRRFSFDELPELINVFKGEMSLVGPRPLLPDYLALYSREQRRRHSVLPGITGLAQVRGRNIISWTERLAYDLEYVDRCSFGLDLVILAKTVPVWLSGVGVNSKHADGSQPFTGDN